MVVEAGAERVSGVPVPTAVPPHEPLYQASVVPEPPVAVSMTLPVLAQTAVGLADADVGAVGVEHTTMEFVSVNGLLAVPPQALVEKVVNVTLYVPGAAGAVMLNVSLKVPLPLWSVVLTQLLPEMFHRVPRQLDPPVFTSVTTALMLALGVTVTVDPPFRVTD